MEKIMSKLNIGSSNPTGKYRDPEWTNIDCGGTDFGEGVLKIDATAMPTEWKDHFDEIHAVHVMEHINRNQRFLFVQECRRVLSPKGVLYLEVPDFEQVIRTLVKAMNEKDERMEHQMTTSVFGKQRYTGDQHCWGFTRITLPQLLHENGFEKVEIYTNRDLDNMISHHYKQEPILLAKATGKKYKSQGDNK